VVVSYGVGGPGNGRLTLTAVGAATPVVTDTGSYTIPIVLRAVAVRAELAERQHFTSAGGSQRVFVKNLQAATASYNLTSACTGTASGCAVQPLTLTLNPGESGVATVTYNLAATAGNGTATVKAVDVASSTLRDSA